MKNERIDNKELIVVTVQGDDYRVAEKTKIWSSDGKEPSQYNDGAVNTTKDPQKAERTGILGQLAFRHLTGLETDLSFIVNGDGGSDFKWGEMYIDMKTATRYNPKFNMQVRCINENGHPIEIKSDVFVCGAVVHEDRDNKEASIAMVGWTTKPILMKNRPVLGRSEGARWKNYEVPHAKLYPVGYDLLACIHK